MSKVVEPTCSTSICRPSRRARRRASRGADALRGIAVDRDAVGVVVSEAVTNAVLHAYRDREQPGQVHVSASLDDDGVEVSVADDGLGMRPRADSPGRRARHAADRRPRRPRRDHLEHPGDGVRIAARFAADGPRGPARPPLGRTSRGPRRTADRPPRRRLDGRRYSARAGAGRTSRAPRRWSARSPRCRRRSARRRGSRAASARAPARTRRSRGPTTVRWSPRGDDHQQRRRVRSTAGTCPARTPRTSRRCAACTR